MPWKKGSDGTGFASSSKKRAVDLRKIAAFARSNKYLFVFLLFALIAAALLLHGGQSGEEAAQVDFRAYAERVQTETEQTLSSMAGVGKCKVVITFSDEGESVYARNETQNGEKREYVLFSSRGDGLLLKIYTPSVLGVAVICTGGDSTKVKNDVTEVVSRLFDISPERISVKKSN